MAKSQETVEKLKKLGHDTDRIVLKKGEAIMEYKDAVLRIRACQDELLTAQIMLVEATSDVSALEEQNSGIHQQLEEETARSQEAERKSKEAKLAAKEAKKACEEVLIEDPEMNDKIGDVNKTIEELEAEKQAEENKLALYAVGNAHVIDDFNRRKDEIDKLGEKITDTEGRLGRIQDEITKIREVWEPELDKLISHISDAFAFNFEQIGCAGEVAVHKDDDFNQWAIQIKVKFRYVLCPSHLTPAHIKFNPLTISKRKRNPPTPRLPPPIRRRALRLDNFLPNVPPIPRTGALPRRRRNQSRHGSTQRAHGARTHGRYRVQGAYEPVLFDHAEVAHWLEV